MINEILAAVMVAVAAPVALHVNDFGTGIYGMWTRDKEIQLRPRAREVGVSPGVLSPGPFNAITDVAGVRVGHFTLIEGDDVRTGATAILPHGGNLFLAKVPAAVVVGNGFGKLMGTTQIKELGEIETPIILTNTLCVPRAADAVLNWTLGWRGNEGVRSVNPIVGETNDGFLNDIRKRALTPGIIERAIRTATDGAVEEGAVGAGAGTVCFGWKGGIGTSSRVLSERQGGYTIGVLVQTNFGGDLHILGVPVGRELDRGDGDAGDGSVMIVVATDAPLSSRNLERLARRALIGVGRTGSNMSNGSGDYVIAFSTAVSVRRTPERRAGAHMIEELPNGRMSPLFQAVAEATEEAIYNSLFKATTVTGYRGRTVRALPIERVLGILRKYGRLPEGAIDDRRLASGRTGRRRTFFLCPQLSAVHGRLLAGIGPANGFSAIGSVQRDVITPRPKVYGQLDWLDFEHHRFRLALDAQPKLVAVCRDGDDGVGGRLPFPAPRFEEHTARPHDKGPARHGRRLLVAFANPVCAAAPSDVFGRLSGPPNAPPQISR